MRGEARARETALKISLGAGPLRLLGEALRESVGIAVLGCALGLPFAWVVTEALRRSIVLPTDFGISVAARIDGRIVLAAVTGGGCRDFDLRRRAVLVSWSGAWMFGRRSKRGSGARRGDREMFSW